MERLWWWSLARVKSQLAGNWRRVARLHAVAWQRSTFVNLKDEKLAALLGKAAGGAGPPCSFSGRWWVWGPPTAAARCFPRHPQNPSPDLAVHVTNSGTTLAPRSACPGLKRPIAGVDTFPYQRRYPYVVYRTWQCWPPTPATNSSHY